MADRGYKRPESVLVVVYSRDGQVLLLRRLWPADFWQSVTGSLAWDEHAEQAAYRELREETGLGPPPPIVPTGVCNRFPILPEWRSRYGPGVSHNREHVFRFELSAPRAVVLNPTEHSEYRWLDLEEALDRVSSWTNRAAIEALRPLRVRPG